MNQKLYPLKGYPRFRLLQRVRVVWFDENNRLCWELGRIVGVAWQAEVCMNPTWTYYVEIHTINHDHHLARPHRLWFDENQVRSLTR